jgi:glycerol-3-phosphate dehydrogenase subunit C
MGIGYPAVHFMDRIPEMRLMISEADCCGSGGTFAMKAENHAISASIRKTIISQIEHHHPDRITCESETCRWWIGSGTNLDTVHPIEILAEAMGIQ